MPAPRATPPLARYAFAISRFAFAPSFLVVRRRFMPIRWRAQGVLCVPRTSPASAEPEREALLRSAFLLPRFRVSCFRPQLSRFTFSRLARLRFGAVSPASKGVSSRTVRALNLEAIVGLEGSRRVANAPRPFTLPFTLSPCLGARARPFHPHRALAALGEPRPAHRFILLPFYPLHHRSVVQRKP